VLLVDAMLVIRSSGTTMPVEVRTHSMKRRQLK